MGLVRSELPVAIFSLATRQPILLNCVAFTLLFVVLCHTTATVQYCHARQTNCFHSGWLLLKKVDVAKILNLLENALII